ncbi:MAG: CHASE3 domain-containing protein [Candidatus Obscuribacterales bacterium]|nr:CHASE3 domain-containing protein [Candidatus Obscuribacterales bacterium]
MKVGKRLTYMACGTVLVIAVVGVTCSLSLSKLVEAHLSATHEREVIGKLDYCMFRVMDATSAQRGYLLTGQTMLFESYRNGVEEASQALEDLRVLVAKSPKQLDRVDKLGAALKERWTLLQESVETYRKGGRELAISNMRGSDWVHLRKEWTAICQEIRSEEELSLQARDEQVDDGTFTAITTVIFGTLFSAVFVGFSSYLFGHHITASIRQLLKASANIEKGRFDTIITIRSDDEFADLADAYTTLGQKLLVMSEDLVKSRQRAAKLGDQLEAAREHLSQLSSTIDEDSAALLEQIASKTDEWGERTQLLIDNLKASSTEVLHRVAAVQEKLTGASGSTNELCSEIERFPELQAMLDDLTTQMEVLSVAGTMELKRSPSAEPAIIALIDKFSALADRARQDKLTVQKLMMRIQMISQKSMLLSQDASSSLATTKLASNMLSDSIKSFPDMEAESNEMMDDLLGSVRLQASKLVQGKEKLRELIKEIDRHYSDTALTSKPIHLEESLSAGNVPQEVGH